MDVQPRQGKVSFLSGTFLVAGTSIGAGMLAMPVVTGTFGFLPSLLVNTFCWLFMVATGLLVLEVSLWMDEGAHILSMTKRFLGRGGELLGGIVFLFLYYSLLVSYFSGGAPLTRTVLEGLGIYLSPAWGHLIFAALFGGIICWGSGAIDRINQVLVVAMLGSGLLLMLIGSSAIQVEFLLRQRWMGAWLAAPTLFGAFGYHNIVPSLATYMRHNVRALRASILLGTTITYLVYSFWQCVVLGSVSEEALLLARTQGRSVAEALQTVVHHPWIPILGTYFALFAIITSLLGVAFSMVDFLGDGLGSSREGLPRVWLTLLTVVPPAVFAVANPGVFVEAIGFAGGYGEAVLNGLLPVCMVWIGRYKCGLDSELALPGGKGLLLILGAITLVVMGIETLHLLG
jgi:tyrosine-specific transport protein